MKKRIKIEFRNEFIVLFEDDIRILEVLNFNGHYMLECFYHDGINLTGNGIDRNGEILCFKEEEVLVTDFKTGKTKWKT